MAEKSYFILDIETGRETKTCGPFDSEKEAQEMLDLISSVKRLGYSVIAECPRIVELETD